MGGKFICTTVPLEGRIHCTIRRPLKGFLWSFRAIFQLNTFLIIDIGIQRCIQCLSCKDLNSTQPNIESHQALIAQCVYPSDDLNVHTYRVTRPPPPQPPTPIPADLPKKKKIQQKPTCMENCPSPPVLSPRAFQTYICVRPIDFSATELFERTGAKHNGDHDAPLRPVQTAGSPAQLFVKAPVLICPFVPTGNETMGHEVMVRSVLPWPHVNPSHYLGLTADLLPHNHSM